MQIESIPLDDLLGRLEQGDLVLTVNKRLARHLRQGYDRRKQNQGCSVWASPAVYSFSAWQRQLIGRLGLDDKTLDQAQVLRLWERAVEADLNLSGEYLMRIPDAAKEAARAHQLLCEYGATFTPEEGGEDHRTFLRWRERWQELCLSGGWDDPALLSERLVQALKHGDVPLPGDLWLAGFDDLSPTVEALCSTLHDRGVVIHRWMPSGCESRSSGRVGYADPDEEVRCCARWTRQLLESGVESIGIVAVDMTAYQERLQRIFREELTPAALLPGSGSEKAFNLSLGTRLLDEGMVTAAFELLSVGRNVSLDSMSYILRSPFVWGHLSEQHSRAILDRELRNLRMAELPLKQVLHFAGHGFKKKLGRSDIFARLLEIITNLQKETRPLLPGAWSRHFAQVLDACQWPGDRTLTSREYQVFTAWKELLAAMACLDTVSEPMSRGEALALLRRLAAEEIFQPEGSEGRVQVLGALESAGMQFDAMWLLGIHEETLPAPARPNPFIPPGLQRRLKMPHADAARELDFAHKLSQRLLSCARVLVVSWPERMEGRERHPSPLVHHLPLVAPVLADSRKPALLIRESVEGLETYADEQGPPIPEGTRVSGGTALLKDQALCPFRAFARHRLGAWGLASGSLGLDELDRGSLVHRILELFWLEIGSWRKLHEMGDEALCAVILKYSDQALDELAAQRRVALTPSQRILEGQRLTKLLREWLEIEAGRPPFSIETIEAWHRENFGPLTLQTRIDRIDRLDDGSQVIIDYKTGLATVTDWLGDRPVEPQLPLYTLGRHGSGLAAVAFAKVRRGDCAFVGLGRESELLPGVAGTAGHRQLEGSDIGNWDDLLQSWRSTLHKLGSDFSGGKAGVDPINASKACDRCDLHAFCRIADQNDLHEEEELL
jgi:probable DNA repair protein